MGWDGISNGFFNFLYTLWLYRSCIYLLIYRLKNCQQHFYGFQNFMSSWGFGIFSQNYNMYVCFWKIMFAIHSVHLEIILSLTNFISNRYSVPSGSTKDLHEAEGRRPSPPNGLCKAAPNGPIWYSLPFVAVYRRLFDSFNLLAEIRFLNLENV